MANTLMTTYMMFMSQKFNKNIKILTEFFFNIQIIKRCPMLEKLKGQSMSKKLMHAKIKMV